MSSCDRTQKRLTWEPAFFSWRQEGTGHHGLCVCVCVSMCKWMCVTVCVGIVSVCTAELVIFTSFRGQDCQVAGDGGPAYNLRPGKYNSCTDQFGTAWECGLQNSSCLVPSMSPSCSSHGFTHITSLPDCLLSHPVGLGYSPIFFVCFLEP